MLSNTKIGLGLTAVVATVAAVIFVFSRAVSVSSSDAGERKAVVVPESRTASPQTPSSLPGASVNTAAGSAPPVYPPLNTSSSAAQLKAQRAEQKIARAQAVTDLKKIMAKGGAADPKELNSALAKLEKTITSKEGKLQIAMSRKVYENSARIQTLAMELGELTKANKPQTKAREQQILSEIQGLQLDIKNAADATREFAAKQLRAPQ